MNQLVYIEFTITKPIGLFMEKKETAQRLNKEALRGRGKLRQLTARC